MLLIETFGLLIGVAFTVMVLSFVLKENILYRIAATTMIGASAGQLAAISWTRLVLYGKAFSAGHLSYVIPILFFGPVLFTVFLKKYSWLARMGISLLMGLGVGLTMVQLIDTQIWKLLKSNLLTLNFDNLVTIVSLFSVLCYFIFYKPFRTGTIGKIIEPIGEIGKLFMMLAFGATWGNLMLGMFTMVYDRILNIVDVIR